MFLLPSSGFKFLEHFIGETLENEFVFLLLFLLDVQIFLGVFLSGMTGQNLEQVIFFNLGSTIEMWHKKFNI